MRDKAVNDMMKKSLLIIVTALAVILFRTDKAMCQEQEEVNYTIVRFLSKALLDSTSQIGCFEVPGANSTPKTMKSGIIPEQESNFLELAIKYSIVKLDMVKGIRGNFDNVIFLSLPMAGTGTVQNTFLPKPGSQWILVLSPMFARPSDSVAYTNRKDEKIRKSKLIKYDTYFGLTSPAESAVCTEWPEGSKSPSSVYRAPSGLSDDLKLIAESIVKGKVISGNGNIEKKLKTNHGRAIWESISRKSK